MRILKNKDEWRDMLNQGGFVNDDEAEGAMAEHYPPPQAYPCFVYNDISNHNTPLYIYRWDLYQMLVTSSDSESVVIEKDLGGILITQPLTDQIKAEVLQARGSGANSVDIIIRRVALPGFPDLIVDHGRHLLQTLARAVELINTPKSEKIQRALRIADTWNNLGSPAQREWLSAVIEILNRNGKTFFDEFPIDQMFAAREKARTSDTEGKEEA